VKLPWVGRAKYEAERDWKNQQILLLQDLTRQLSAERDYLREQLDAARGDSTKSREMVADWLAQKMFGRSIYGSPAPELPESLPESEALLNLKGRIQGRAYTHLMAEKFRAEYESALAQRAATAREANQHLIATETT